MDTVEKMIFRLPEGQCELADRIRTLILASHPDMREQLHFSTPFFSCKGWVCYMGFIGDRGVDIGFTKGHRLTDPLRKLEARNRKLVRSFVAPDYQSFDENYFLEVLQEAITLDQQMKKFKKAVNG